MCSSDLEGLGTTDADSKYGYVSTINSNGFSVAAGSLGQQYVNTSAATYVGWQWKAGGTAVTNTAGSITSQVSANTTAGFSVSTYTGNNVTAATVGHGLGVKPAMVIVKERTSTHDWFVWHQSLPSGYQLRLNTTAAQEQVSSATNYGGLGTPTSTTFGFIAGLIDVENVNTSGYNYVAYCFAAIAGYSAFGSYTGNGSADGPFVFLGFRPRWIMFKRTDSTSDWVILDTSRNTYNVMNSTLYADLSSAEATYTWCDYLSNGFKFRDASNGLNNSGGTYIYAAFAENPFQNALAR